MALLTDFVLLVLVISGFEGRISFANKLIREDDYYQSKCRVFSRFLVVVSSVSGLKGVHKVNC